MKPDSTYKRVFNRMADWLETLPEGSELPAETALGHRFAVSRTTIRKALSSLEAAGALAGSGRGRRTRRTAGAIRRYPEAETISPAEQVEARFMAWLQSADARPGTMINEAELARRFGVATSSIREFLNRFQQFGLIARCPGTGWELRGFTRSFAIELFEIREMFELRSARAFGRLPPQSPAWEALAEMRERHVLLEADVAQRYNEFPELDAAFHRLVFGAVPNRFIDKFSDVIGLIFHYHYQWNRHDERTRNAAALTEHLAYIDALFSRNAELIELACRAHLASARETLLRAIAG